LVQKSRYPNTRRQWPEFPRAGVGEKRTPAGALNGMDRGLSAWISEMADRLRGWCLVARAGCFAIRVHAGARRLNGMPFVLHPCQVALVLWAVGVRDPETLAGALLHDTLEQGVPPARLKRAFRPPVLHCVRELTDDMRLSRSERKRRQIAGAPALSRPARLIRLADKALNLRDMPSDWNREARARYLGDAWKVRDALRGTQPELEALFDRVHARREADLAGRGESFCRVLAAARRGLRGDKSGRRSA
jgi:guanosine-3',5'-bis(diphosphate) 3'-pyrophosphohydrolase